jgi:3-hydroxymyristoyl/3-hydroxydecanoyl-(acyl carrier protein) dehydratase
MKFRFVDKIISWKSHERITGIKAVSFEEYSLKDALGDEPRLPEMLLLESFLQLGNWLILLSSDFQQMGMVIRINEVRFHDYLRPGRQARLEVTLVRQREDGFELAGDGWVEGRPIISGLGCLAMPVPATEYVNPDDLRVLYSEIYQPESLTS